MHYAALCYALVYNPERMAVPREDLRYISYALQVHAETRSISTPPGGAISQRNDTFCPLIVPILCFSTDFIAEAFDRFVTDCAEFSSFSLPLFLDTRLNYGGPEGTWWGNKRDHLIPGS